MYDECRHIMPNGARCHSPALRGQDYCYYHTRLHQRAKSSASSGARSAAASTPQEPLKLPIIEDRSAILVALAEIFDGLGSGKIDRQTAYVYLYGLQIGSQAVERRQDVLPFKAVQAVFHSRDGQELAPELRICEEADKCSTCKEKDTCNAYEPDEDEDEDDDESWRRPLVP